MNPRLDGTVALVTGGTGGIGLATARALSTRGATVVVVGRRPDSTTRAARALTSTPGAGPVDALTADLAVQREVRRVADHVHRTHPRLDVLVNNIGVVAPHAALTEDGTERTFATNHLAAFLLTDLLLPLLTASAPARVVTVTSSAHRIAALDPDDLQSLRGYRLTRAYNRSKLANLLFHLELTRRTAGTGVTTVALDPGGARTGLATGPGVPLVFRLLRLVAPSPDTVARGVVHAALADQPHGACITRTGRPATLSPTARDPRTAEALWNASAALVSRPGGPAAPPPATPIAAPARRGTPRHPPRTS